MQLIVIKYFNLLTTLLFTYLMSVYLVKLNGQKKTKAKNRTNGAKVLFPDLRPVHWSRTGFTCFGVEGQRST